MKKLLLLLPALAASAVPLEKSGVFEDFSDPAAGERWSYFWGTGGDARVSVVPDPGDAAKKAGAFNYTISAENGGLTMIHGRRMPPETTRVSLRVHSNGSGPKLDLRIHDATGETFLFPLCGNMDWKGWKTFEVDPAAPAAAWGGNNDKKMDDPPAIALQISSPAPGKGTVLVSDITTHYRVTDANRYVFAIANDPPGNIWFGEAPGAEVAFTLADRADEAGEFTVESYVTRGANPPLTARATQNLRLEPGRPARVSVPLGATAFGHYRVAATLRKKDGALVDRVEATAAIVPEGPKPSPDSPFGFNLRQNALEIAAKSGVSWTREEFSWERVEPVQGQYNWEPFDAAVRDSRALGINILGLLTYSATWARKTPNEYTSPPRDVNDYANYVFAVVSRYKNDVTHWEIWNEPDCNGFWPPNGRNAAEYFELLKAGHAAAKRADPACVVMNGGLLAGVCHPDIWDFPEDIGKLGAAAFLDAFGWHPYGDPHSPEAARYTQRANTLLDILKKYGVTQRLWLTEQAWSTGNEQTKSVGEELQACYLVRGHVLALANPAVEKFIWFLFRDGGGRDHDYEQSYGILNPDCTPKPAYPAYVQMTRALAGNKIIGPVPVANNHPDIQAYEFSAVKPQTSAGNGVIVAWTTSEQPLQINVARSLRFSDPFGNPCPNPDRNATRLTLARQPIYIGTAPLDRGHPLLLQALAAAEVSVEPGLPPQPPVRATLLDDFTGVKWGETWKLGWPGSGHEGTTLATAPDPEDPAKKCSRLDYAADPAKGRYNLCYVQVDINAPLPETTAAISLRVFGDNSGHPLGIRLVDRYGETFGYNLAPAVDWTGWRELKADIQNDRFHAFGGDANNRLDPPFQLQGIVLDITPPRVATGTLWLGTLTLHEQ